MYYCCSARSGRKSQLGFFGIFKASSSSCMISGEASMAMAHPTYLFFETSAKRCLYLHLSKYIQMMKLPYCMWISGLYEHDHMCDYRNLWQNIYWIIYDLVFNSVPEYKYKYDKRLYWVATMNASWCIVQQSIRRNKWSLSSHNAAVQPAGWCAESRGSDLSLLSKAKDQVPWCHTTQADK